MVLATIYAVCFHAIPESQISLPVVLLLCSPSEKKEIPKKEILQQDHDVNGFTWIQCHNRNTIPLLVIM
jgi:hypothetical protein